MKPETIKKLTIVTAILVIVLVVVMFYFSRKNNIKWLLHTFILFVFLSGLLFGLMLVYP